MNRTAIPVNKIELEMIRVLLQGTREDLRLSNPEDKDEVSIELSLDEVKYLFDHMDILIGGQETDQGDWVRASEWRKAKSPLIAKLRPLVFRMIPHP